MARTADLLEARVSLTGGVGGRIVEIRAGDIAESDSSVVAAFPKIWGPVTVRFRGTPEPAIEQATAAPGEKRGRR